MNLKRVCVCLSCCLLASSLWAQVEVEVSLEQDQFLPGERLPVKVRVINHSGQTLRFGEDNSWLTLTVEAEDSYVIPRTGEVPVAGIFDLPPSKMGTKELDLAPYFTLTRPGRYSIVATVAIKEWHQSLSSPPVAFDIIRGTKLWEQVFGVPGSKSPEGAPEVRKYLLQQANYLQGRLQLYVRVTDVSETQTYRVVDVGPLVSLSRPEAQLDARSNLHVLYQSGPRGSTYCVIDPDGEVLSRENFEYGSSRPRLSAAGDGSVSVVGGVRLPSAPETTAPAGTQE